MVQGDYTYASTSADADLPLHLLVNAGVRQTSLTLTGGYNWQATPQSTVDWLTGVRYWDIRACTLTIVTMVSVWILNSMDH